MSRYYEIALSGSNIGGSTGAARTWSSYPNGKNDPGALNVELDLLSGYLGIPAGDIGSSTITIEGVPLSDLLQANQFAGMNVSVKGGMKKGLPLANPSQSGLLLQGQIFQSFGNWAGTDMNLNFVVLPALHTYANPGNFVLNWQKGQSLADALNVTLQTAIPQYARSINISDKYATSGTLHACSSLSALSQFVQRLTAQQYPPGVNIGKLAGNTVVVSDASNATAAVQLSFFDLVGQPKWIQPDIMQFTTVMRADIQIDTYVKMPDQLQNLPGIVNTAASSFPSSLKYQSTFKGTFIVQSVRHVGNFRDPNGSSWVSIFQVTPVQNG